MDPLTDLLAGPRARGAFTLRAQFEPPWSIDVQDDAPLTVVAVLTGTARLRHGGADEPLQAGDVAVVQGVQPYVVSDGRGTAPTVRVLPGNRCVDLAGRPVVESMSHGLRTWGNAACDCSSGCTPRTARSAACSPERSRRGWWPAATTTSAR